MRRDNSQTKSSVMSFAILTTVTLFVWIFVEAYQIFNKRSFDSIPPAVLAPLAPTFESGVLGDLEKRKFYSEDQLRTPRKSSVVESSPSASQTSEGTATPTPSPVPVSIPTL